MAGMEVVARAQAGRAVRRADASWPGSDPVGPDGGSVGNCAPDRPASELHIAEDWYRKSALEDLLGLPSERDWARHSEGCYLLRTDIADWDAEQLWRTYIQLSEAEAAFRIHKSELA